MEYELHRGDCLQIMPTLAGPVDMILADLPYGTTACAWDSVIPFEPLWAQYKRLIKPRGAVVLFGSQPFTSALVMSNPGWFKYTLIWDKQKAGNFLTAKLMPMITHEDVSVFSPATVANCAPANMVYMPQLSKRDKPIKYRKGSDSELYARKNTLSVWYVSGVAYPKSILTYPKESGYHPTQKPVALLEYLIRTYTNEGETVLDNTMGSGSTGVACMNTKRRFIGIEQDTDYFAIAERRIADAARQARGEFRHVTDTQTHDDLPLFAGV